MSWPAEGVQPTAVHVGTSGWSYAHWENVLYPPGLPVGRRLDRYVQEFRTTELNASFHRWPPDRTFAGWQRRLPPGFLLSVKAPRGLTHAKRLYAPEVWVRRLPASPGMSPEPVEDPHPRTLRQAQGALRKPRHVA